MSVARFIPTIWSARLLQNLNKSLIYGQPGVVNKDFEGEIREAGDRVYIHGIGEVAISDYTRDTTTINYQLLTDSRQELLIDQSKYFAFRVDDLDIAQQKPKVIDGASQQASYNLAEVADRYLAGFYTAAGTVQDNGAGAAVQLTAANVYQQLVRASVTLDEKNVPDTGRYAIVPPWVAGLLLDNDRFLSASGDSVLNGQIGSVAGFSVLKSNNVPSTGTTSVVHHITCGHNMAISYAEQIAKTEGIRLQNSFADAVRGLHLYGARVVKPEALLVIRATK